MFSYTVIALIIGVGSGAWLYGRFQRSTGNNTKSSVISATVSGAVIFVILWILLEILFKHLNK